jgi:hypothetical protein
MVLSIIAVDRDAGLKRSLCQHSPIGERTEGITLSRLHHTDLA